MIYTYSFFFFSVINCIDYFNDSNNTNSNINIYKDDLRNPGFFPYNNQIIDHFNQATFHPGKINENVECRHNLNIYLSQTIRISCSPSFDLQIKYDELKNYSFNQYGNSIIFHNINTNNNNIQNVISSLNIFQTPNLIFEDFLDGKSVLSYSNSFNSKYKNLFITINWDKYSVSNSVCPWDAVSNSKHEEIITNFDELVKNTNWRKVCISSYNNWIAYLYLRDHDPPGELIIIPKITAIYIAIPIIGLIIILFVTSLLIALWKYKHTIYEPEKYEKDTEDYDSDESSERRENNHNQGILKSLDFTPGDNIEGIPRTLNFDPDNNNEGIQSSYQFHPTHSNDERFRLDQDFSVAEDDRNYQGLQRSLQFPSDQSNDERFRIDQTFYPDKACENEDYSSLSDESSFTSSEL